MDHTAPREPWADALASGRFVAAWDVFLTSHHGLLMSTIRHHALDHDDVMDMYAFVCERLAADECARLRRFRWNGTAKFSTWLVTVVRNLLIDWHRHRHGRRTWDRMVHGLPDLEQAIFLRIVRDGVSYVEAYEYLTTSDHPDLTFAAFLRAVRHLHATVLDRGGVAARELLGHDPTAGIDPDHVRVPDAGTVDIQRALSTLDPDVRTAVVMLVVDGLPARRVAEMLGWTGPKAVYRRVGHALEQLRTVLDP